MARFCNPCLRRLETGAPPSEMGSKQYTVDLLLGCIAYAEVRQGAVGRKRSRERTDSLTRVMA